jgi:hypothetical protein
VPASSAAVCSSVTKSTGSTTTSGSLRPRVGGRTPPARFAADSRWRRRVTLLLVAIAAPGRQRRGLAERGLTGAGSEMSTSMSSDDHNRWPPALTLTAAPDPPRWGRRSTVAHDATRPPVRSTMSRPRPR